MKSAAQRRPSRYTHAPVLTSTAPSTVTLRFVPGVRTRAQAAQHPAGPPDTKVLQHPALPSYDGKKVIVGMRPEHLPAAGNRRTGPPLVGEVDLVEALGSELEVHFTLDAVQAVAEGAATEDAEAAVINGEDVPRVAPQTPVKPGDKITFAVQAEGMQFFDPISEEAIWN
jgi:multiple sugar transport system ATP-binding protein